MKTGSRYHLIFSLILSVDVQHGLRMTVLCFLMLYTVICERVKYPFFPKRVAIMSKDII